MSKFPPVHLLLDDPTDTLIVDIRKSDGSSGGGIPPPLPYFEAGIGLGQGQAVGTAAPIPVIEGDAGRR